MPLNIDWQQILLHMFNFALLFFAMYFILYKPIHNFMEKREQGYLDKKAEADGVLKDAEKVKAEYEQKLENAQAEADRIKEQSRTEAMQSAAKITDAARAEAEVIKSKAKAAAEAERDEMMVSAKKEIADTASAIAEKIVSGDDAYDQFIDALGRSGKDA